MTCSFDEVIAAKPEATVSWEEQCQRLKSLQHTSHISNSWQETRMGMVGCMQQNLHPHVWGGRAAISRNAEAMLPSTKWVTATLSMLSMGYTDLNLCIYIYTYIIYIYIYVCIYTIYIYYRRKFRSQTSDNIERWKSSQQGEESEEKRSEERRCRCAKR